MTMHYLYSLPPQWGYVRGSAAAVGTEGRKAQGVEYTSTSQRDPEWQRFYRRQASRHQRREAALHIAEQLDALSGEVYQRRFTRDAEAYREERILDEQYDAAYGSTAETRLASFAVEAGTATFAQRVLCGACHICGKFSC